MTLRPDTLARFTADLARLLPGGGRIGVAVSGGPDSLALLILSHAAQRRDVEAATVDHGLRAESIPEAEFVGELCRSLGVPHVVLRVTVPEASSLQAQAREARYAALARWAEERGLAAVLTAHHADDQAETLLMRLARGSGLGGVAGVRSSRPLSDSPAGPLLLRPLLAWRKHELQAIVRDARISPVDDPSNSHPRHDRTRARALLAGQDWLDPTRLAASAAHLAEAEDALRFTAQTLLAERMHQHDGAVSLSVADLPRELQRRLLLLAFAQLRVPDPRGPDLDRAVTALANGESCTLGGLKLEGGATWRISPAPPRR